MLKYFICPDGTRIEIAECLEHCPRAEGRCMSLPTLKVVGSQRPWTGTASTTQLLKGTREAYLEITEEFAIDPDEHAFMVLGTRHHQLLDKVAKKLKMISEEKLKGEVSGILDLLEPDDGGNSYTLWDYKTTASYKIANVLGLTDKPPDLRDWTLQLNNYRLMLEGLGFNISQMLIQCTARDGKTWLATKRGITRNVNKVSVPRLDDDEVAGYFTAKNHALQEAMNTNTLPPMCDYEERWSGRKCKGFCAVMEFCPEGRAINKMGKE